MPNAADLVAAARQRIREITPQELSAKLSGLTVIDVREPAEFAAGHLPGAINIPRGLLEFKVETAIPDHDRALVLHCQGGGRSALATVALQELGYRNVVNLAGGFAACVAAGLPTER
ncbi:MAG TPA: rhodanese-like domain-containing protein [Gammaproteobacteria bacterium]|nr:rhodanese-like domain-containing protein [Gammaproteobacteria bacterium]